MITVMSPISSFKKEMLMSIRKKMQKKHHSTRKTVVTAFFFRRRQGGHYFRISRDKLRLSSFSVGSQQARFTGEAVSWCGTGNGQAQVRRVNPRCMRGGCALLASRIQTGFARHRRYNSAFALPCWASVHPHCCRSKISDDDTKGLHAVLSFAVLMYSGINSPVGHVICPRTT